MASDHPVFPLFLPSYDPDLSLSLCSVCPQRGVDFSPIPPHPQGLLTHQCLHFLLSSSGVQEDARADVVDCVVRDIQNSQCLLNVEYSGPTCPHVTIQFGDTKDDVGLGLVKEGLVMVDVRKEKHLQKMVGGLEPPGGAGTPRSWSGSRVCLVLFSECC